MIGFHKLFTIAAVFTKTGHFVEYLGQIKNFEYTFYLFNSWKPFDFKMSR